MYVLCTSCAEKLEKQNIEGPTATNQIGTLFRLVVLAPQFKSRVDQP